MIIDIFGELVLCLKVSFHNIVSGQGNSSFDEELEKVGEEKTKLAFDCIYIVDIAHLAWHWE